MGPDYELPSGGPACDPERRLIRGTSPHTRGSSFFNRRIKQTFGAVQERRAAIELKSRSAEAAEAELTRFVERRHEKRVKAEGERSEHELWEESVKACNAREREQNRWEWVRYFDRMAKSHAALAADYERRADELCEKGEAA